MKKNGCFNGDDKNIFRFKTNSKSADLILRFCYNQL